MAVYIIIPILLGLIPASIASKKGGSFFTWWVFGALLWIVALPMAIVLKDKRYGECPFCKEDVRFGATACPHCQRELGPGVAA